MGVVVVVAADAAQWWWRWWCCVFLILVESQHLLISQSLSHFTMVWGGHRHTRYTSTTTFNQVTPKCPSIRLSKEMATWGHYRSPQQERNHSNPIVLTISGHFHCEKPKFEKKHKNYRFVAPRRIFLIKLSMRSRWWLFILDSGALSKSASERAKSWFSEYPSFSWNILKN